MGKKVVYSSHFGTSPDGVRPDDNEEEDIQEGALHCRGCASIYAIREGIPRMVVGELGESSQHRTTAFDIAAKEWEHNFLDLSAPLGQSDFLGKTVLDLGCGYGRHAYFAARFGAEVIAIDNSEDAVLSTKRNTEHMAHVHVIQADASRLPIRSQSMDRVYCYGVLHHVEDPMAILEMASDTIRPGGTLSVWAYGPRQGLTLIINNALRGATTSMSHEQLLKISHLIASSLRLFSHTPYRFFGKVPIARYIVRHLPVHDHHQWPFDVVIADIYDRLRIPVRHWFTKEELEKWYVDTGYSNIQVRRRVRNNETFCAIGMRR